MFKFVILRGLDILVIMQPHSQDNLISTATHHTNKDSIDKTKKEDKITNKGIGVFYLMNE